VCAGLFILFFVVNALVWISSLLSGEFLLCLDLEARIERGRGSCLAFTISERDRETPR